MNSRSISILEFDYHPEVLRNTCRIFEETPFDFHIYTSEQIWTQVDLYAGGLPSNCFLHTHDPHKHPLKQFLSEHLQTINQSDVILYNTVASHYRLYSALRFTPPTILRIHNANAYFNRLASTYRPKLEPFFIWKDLSHFVRNTVLKLDIVHRNRFLKGVDYFAFPSRVIRDHAVQKLGVPGKRGITLPFSFYQGVQGAKPPTSTKNEVTITVIGKIDQRNRDYDLLLNAFSTLAPALEDGDYALRLILLGSAGSHYGKSVLERFRGMENSHFQVVSFPGFVKQRSFNDYIQATDFLVLPTRTHTRYTIYTEHYGHTKLSGGINDIITYGKRALVNSDYPIDEHLSGMVEPFKGSADLARKIKSWCDQRNDRGADVSEVLKPFYLENIRKLYLSVLDGLLK